MRCFRIFILNVDDGFHNREDVFAFFVVQGTLQPIINGLGSEMRHVALGIHNVPN